jgi:hypothetical protein
MDENPAVEDGELHSGAGNDVRILVPNAEPNFAL